MAGFHAVIADESKKESYYRYERTTLGDYPPVEIQVPGLPRAKNPSYSSMRWLHVNQISCPFCSPAERDVLSRNTWWYARWDAFPVTRGHLLVIPFRHFAGFFDARADEMAALPEMLIACRKIVDAKYSPAGYNIVINIGKAADQKVMHCHVHLIPRYAGMADNPPGGIRGIVLGDHGPSEENPSSHD